MSIARLASLQPAGRHWRRLAGWLRTAAADLGLQAPNAPADAGWLRNMHRSGNTVVKLSGVEKRYEVGPVSNHVLTDVDLEIQSGDLISIMGASGSGKSTVMNILGLLDRPSGGVLELAGRPVASMGDDEISGLRNLGIGFVFQSFFLLPRLRAWENVAMPLNYRGVDRAEARLRAEAMLEKVGLKDSAEHRPTQLSGGQQQRVAIARALVGEPAMILADEPTGALDADTGNAIMDLFERINREEQVTIVIITHDQNVARRCRRNLRVVNGGIEELGASPAGRESRA